MAAQPTRAPTPRDHQRDGAPLRPVRGPADHRPLNPRTLVGGLLVAASAVGLYLAATPDADDPGAPVVVAAADLRPGQRVEAGHLTVDRALLPGGHRSFSSVEEVVGRVVLGPVGAGEVLQPAAVSDETAPSQPQREVALALPREQVAVGRLRTGDRVDVLVTSEGATTPVVQGVPVVQLSTGDDDVLGSGRDVRLVVAVTSSRAVTELVHALRTGDVTVVRSTFAAETTLDEVELDGTDEGTSGDEGSLTGSRPPGGAGR